MRFVFLSVFVFFLSVPQGFSLVDYTDYDNDREADEVVKVSRKKRKVRSNKRRRLAVNSPQHNYAKKSSLSGMMDLDISYDSSKVNVGDRVGQIEKIIYDGHLRLPFGLFFNASFYQISSKSSEISESGSYQNGNPLFILGLNWFQIGNAEDAARVDFYGGLSLKQKNSDFAASRTDTVFGLQTSKKMSQSVIALAGEYWKTGSPDNLNESDIGNITRLKMAFGYVFSHDIRFEMTGHHVHIQKSGNDEFTARRLTEDLSFSSVSPRFILSLGRLINFNVGANIQIKKLDNFENVDYLSLKLHQFAGSYGNSVYIGLGTSL